MGRPLGSSPLLTPEITEEICKCLRLSMADRFAAECCGVDERTFRGWQQKGEEGIEPYATFLAAVTRARADGVKRMHRKALRGGKGSSAALWFLERRFRKEYGSAKAEESEQQEVKIVIEGGLPKRQL